MSGTWRVKHCIIIIIIIPVSIGRLEQKLFSVGNEKYLSTAATAVLSATCSMLTVW